MNHLQEAQRPLERSLTDDDLLKPLLLEADEVADAGRGLGGGRRAHTMHPPIIAFAKRTVSGRPALRAARPIRPWLAPGGPAPSTKPSARPHPIRARHWRDAASGSC